LQGRNDHVGKACSSIERLRQPRTYGYLPQGLPTSLSGSGGITYINVARYDASGRPTYIRQNGVISRHWDYYPWKVYGTNPQDNNPGGLKAIGAGNDAYPWTRQNMTGRLHLN